MEKHKIKESQNYSVHYVQIGKDTISKVDELICAAVYCYTSQLQMFQILSSL